MPYITYLTNTQQTNRAPSHAGYGMTKEESQRAAKYWANQRPWVRTVPFSRAPQWAIEEARQAYHTPCDACGRVHPAADRATICVDHDGTVLPVAETWPTSVAVYQF